MPARGPDVGHGRREGWGVVDGSRVITVRVGDTEIGAEAAEPFPAGPGAGLP